MTPTFRYGYIAVHLLVPVLVVLVPGLLGGLWTWSWVVAVPLFALVDHLGGRWTRNLEEGEAERVARAPYYRRLLYAGVALQGALLVAGCWAAQRLAAWEILGYSVWGGIAGATLGIVVGHELIHKREPVFQLLGGLVLSMVAYGTFKVEHVRGHHVWVATPEDPSSAPLGQSLYRFLGRALLHNPRNGFRLEAERLRARGLSGWSPRNELIWWTLLSLGLAAAVHGLFGLRGLGYFVGQVFFAIVTLETLNYVEHYGLRRRRLPDGRYEEVGPHHSWSAVQTGSGLLLLNAQRHADHHAHPGRWYPMLRWIDGSPRLPLGYAGMLALAFVPPLWRRWMDPRAFRQREQPAAEPADS